MQPQPISTWQNPRLTGRVVELDGVRGLAILLVLICHHFAQTIHNPPSHSWQAYSLTVLGITWSGVDLFFVLSGFLIGGILYDAKTSPAYYRTFYLRRIARIFPLYFLWTALFVIGLCLVTPASPTPLRALFNWDIPVWSFPLFLQNVLMKVHQTFGPSWILSTWSLAVEEQFYFLLPFLVRQLNCRGIVGVAGTAIVLAPIVRVLLSNSGDPFIGPYTLLPCRADALGFGVLIALAARNERIWNWLVSHRSYLYAAFFFAGCGVLFLLKYQQWLYGPGLSWIAISYSLLLLLTLVNPGPLEKAVFRSTILVKLGTVAYAVYIFHQGIYGLYQYAFFGRQPVIDGWPSFFVTLLSIATVLLMAALSWRFLEKPLIRYAHANFSYAAKTKSGAREHPGKNAREAMTSS